MPIPLNRVVQKTFLRAGSATLAASGAVGSYTNLPPTWSTVPTVTFTQGQGADYSIDPLESDPNPGEQTSVSYIGSGLPSGVQLIAASKVYRYDGITAPGSTDLNRLRATDNGVPVLFADSNLHRVEIVSGLVWSTTPTPSYVELTTTAYNAGQHVSLYNAATDEFRVTPGFSLPSWLSLTPGPGAGSGNLTPNGTQLDANDIPANPGIKIDVRRSGGAWVSSPAFGVTVAAVSPITATWVNLAYTSVNANKDFYATSVRVDGSGNWRYGPFFSMARQRDYTGMGDGTPDTQAVWDSFATMADDLAQAAPGWVAQETPPWGGWTMYGVDYDFNLALFVPG